MQFTSKDSVEKVVSQFSKLIDSLYKIEENKANESDNLGKEIDEKFKARVEAQEEAKKAASIRQKIQDLIS